MVQVTKSLQDPLEVRNNLPGISDNTLEILLIIPESFTETNGNQRAHRERIFPQSEFAFEKNYYAQFTKTTV